MDEEQAQRLVYAIEMLIEAKCGGLDEIDVAQAKKELGRTLLNLVDDAETPYGLDYPAKLRSY